VKRMRLLVGSVDNRRSVVLLAGCRGNGSGVRGAEEHLYAAKHRGPEGQADARGWGRARGVSENFSTHFLTGEGNAWRLQGW